MEGAAARPAIVRKESGGTLAWNWGHLPFNTVLGLLTTEMGRLVNHSEMNVNPDSDLCIFINNTVYLHDMDTETA